MLSRSQTVRELVTVNFSPYKVWAGMWRGLYMCVTVRVCLSPSLCGNLQTHLARHKQQWPGKIAEIPPTYQEIWGFGLTIHTQDRGVGNERATGSGLNCVGLTDTDTNEWYQLTHADADTNIDTMATWVALTDSAEPSWSAHRITTSN